MFRKQLDFAVM